MRFVLAASLVPVALFAQFSWPGSSNKKVFEPSTRLSGIGLDREKLSETVLTRRAQLMMQSQTFSILRDPQALEGAERINSPRLQKIFEIAERQSGLPASFISAIAYLESWGDANAQSPAGPKGIMQIAGGTARTMGLRMIYSTRYRTVSERQLVRKKGKKPVYKTVRRRVPYTVLQRDERLVPELAVPAAARYLARLERDLGGRDWAVFAYHCGEGCTQSVRNVVSRSRGLDGEDTSVAQMFFGFHPAHNRELYDAFNYHMDRDFSPTYYFRIKRAEQLLAMYRKDPAEFKKLFEEYRNTVNPDQRAPHRLSVWLKPQDLAYKNCEDLKRAQGRGLVAAFDDPNFFGFSVRRSGAGAIAEDDLANQRYYLQASPAAMGTIAYIAYETRRLHEAMKAPEKWVPLDITALVQPLDYEERKRHGSGRAELPVHCSGQVFDINVANLPAKQREALEFILGDMGWDGYLGFVRESSSKSVLHVGPSPTAREFFTRVYEEALQQASESD